MATKLTDKQQNMLNQLQKSAEETLRLCKEVENGSVTGEEFERRISKMSLIAGAASLAGK